jgi:predicted GNAT family acetyltransferase
MLTLATRQQNIARPGQWTIAAAPTLTASLLGVEHEAEVLAFLSERPDHTFGMIGFINANGLVSSHNRGTFFACRNERGQLEGVALIGHYILFETRTDSAIKVFARLAQECTVAHMVLGEQDKVDTFWRYYADGGQAPRLFGRELLMEQRWPVPVRGAVQGLRLATLADLDLVIPAHAQSALEESGVNPFEVDPRGFRQRCARRIEQDRTWVWTQNGKLLFKAEVITETALVTYLEGVWVDPQERGKGYGLRCISQLATVLLARSSCVCLLVNEKAEGAQAFYKRAGFQFVGYYDTVFLKQRVN